MEAVNEGIQEKQEAAIAIANELNIATQEHYVKAVAFTKDIKALQKAIRASFDPIVDAANKAHKEAIAQRDKHLRPVKEAEKLLKGKIEAYVYEQERVRKAEEERLRKIAEKKEADARRKAQEAAAEAERLRLEGEEKEAAKLEKKAEKLTQKADTIEAPKLATKVEKVKGISYKDVWDFEVMDATLVPRQFCTPNEQAIRAYIKATKGTMPIEGVKITHRKASSIR